MPFPKFKSGVFAAVLLLSLSAGAEVHFEDTQIWRRAKLLAPSQTVWSFSSSYQNISQRLSQDGRVEALGNQYNRTLTWDQLLAAENSQQGATELRNYMRARGFKESDVAATSTYKIDRQEIGFGIHWAYGLTKRWQIGFEVPLYLRKTRVEQQVEMTPELSRGGGRAGAAQLAARPAGQDLRARAKEIAQSQLANSGYDRVPDQNQSLDWGDVGLLSQFSLLESYRWMWSLQQQVKFPTAQNPSVSDYIQSSSDEGQVDVGVSSLLDYQKRNLLMGARVGYVAQLPDTTRMRVPTDHGAGNPEIDPKVHRDLGDWIWGAVDAEYRVTGAFALSAEYSYLTKGRDRYSGEATDKSDYELMAKNTDQQIHQSRVGFTYKIGSTSMRSGVANKWVTSVDYTVPWVGRNSMDASRASLELINYF